MADDSDDPVAASQAEAEDPAESVDAEAEADVDPEPVDAETETETEDAAEPVADDASPTSGWKVPLLIAGFVILFDQLTKEWALNELGDGSEIHVFWTLQWNLAFNSGMAFGRAEGWGPLIAVVATGVIVWLLLSLRSAPGPMSVVGMGLVIGGAAGNLIDRLFRGDAWLRGAVVDFIDFQWFPIFNIADISINVGAGLLILNALLMSRRPAAGTSP